jgi:pyrroline-5-carboxylate reductase
MASALIGGLRAAGVEAAQLRAADPDPSRRKLLEEEHGIETCADNASLLLAADAIVLAVKPSVALPALETLRGAPEREGPLWISIAAGIPLAAIELALEAPVRTVRAMPNTPALVRAGATAICGNARATAADLTLARSLFESVGVCWTAPNESLLDAVTGLSGSGPAYVFVFLEALGDAGVRMGLPRDAAYLLAFQTVLGAARLAIEGGQHPSSGSRPVGCARPSTRRSQPPHSAPESWRTASNSNALSVHYKGIARVTGEPAVDTDDVRTTSRLRGIPSIGCRSQRLPEDPPCASSRWTFAITSSLSVCGATTGKRWTPSSAWWPRTTRASWARTRSSASGSTCSRCGCRT